MSLSSFVDLPIPEQKARGLFFTAREIAQQPDTWEITLQIFKQNQERICSFLDSIGLQNSLESRPVVMLVGAGTSDYIGHALTLLLRQKWGCEVSACASTELLPNLDEYVVAGRRYLWISFSRSGDSPEAVAVVEQAIKLHPGIAHLVITCNAQARLITVCKEAEHACAIVLDDAVNDRSLAMTSSFTNMVVMGQCLAHAWSIEEYSTILERLVRAGHDFMPRAEQEAERLSLLGLSRACMVGTGSLASVAKESALKVLEMTAGQISTMSETVLGLRHGPMAALDAKTLFLCFVSGEERRANYAADLLREVGEKEITDQRIAIGPASVRDKIAPYCESYLSVDDSLDDAYRPVVDVIFGQLLGFYSSVTRGLKPDSPSPGGVINRVVEKFRIY
ncbi:MAG: tagatose-6-phosphate ketose isomerase [Edaphobacter sp.]